MKRVPLTSLHRRNSAGSEWLVCEDDDGLRVELSGVFDSRRVAFDFRDFVRARGHPGAYVLERVEAKT